MISNQLLIIPVPDMKACIREIIPSNQQAIAKGLQLQCSVPPAVPPAGELTLMRPELSPLAESIQCNTWNDSVMLR